MLILDLKMPHLPHLKCNKYFPYKIDSLVFMCLLNHKFLQTPRRAEGSKNKT